jgi:hypothetical protein
LLGTKENVKKLTNILFPVMTADKLWDEDGNLTKSIVDAENIENWNKLPMEYIGARTVANNIIKGQIRSVADGLIEVIEPKKKDDKKKFNYK